MNRIRIIYKIIHWALLIIFLLFLLSGYMRTRGFIDPYLGAYLHTNLILPMVALFLAHVLIYVRFRFIRIFKSKLLPTLSIVIIGVAAFSGAAYIDLKYIQPSSRPITPPSSEPQLQAFIQIEGIGRIDYNPDEVTTKRPDIFKEGHFSVFDVLAHLDEKNKIALDYHFDELMNTYIIDSINGEVDWWYCAYYDGGWRETNVFRMDHYPYKEDMRIEIFQVHEKDIQRRYDIFREEIDRANAKGKVTIPEVEIRTPSGTLRFENVLVEPHNLRDDVFQEGTITAIDVVISLSDQGLIEYDLKWYETIGIADIKDYWVERINEDTAFGRCGFVYEEGDSTYRGFTGNHIHIPMDIRVLNSPEYFLIFWICI